MMHGATIKFCLYVVYAGCRTNNVFQIKNCKKLIYIGEIYAEKNYVLCYGDKRIFIKETGNLDYTNSQIIVEHPVTNIFKLQGI